MPSGTKISASFELKGTSRLVKWATAVSARVRAAVRGVIATYALKVERKLKHKLSQPGSGQTYQRGGVAHTASAPGESPATDTGRYKSSIRHELRAISARVLTDVEYAAPLEFGTDDIEPRPMWEVVINEVEDDFIRDLRRAVNKALKL